MMPPSRAADTFRKSHNLVFLLESDLPARLTITLQDPRRKP
jgi:hypothetical protein